MKPEIKIKKDNLSTVATIYRLYFRGKWYHSETPKPHYKESYYATKVKNPRYYSTADRAQKEADKYNKYLYTYKKGLQAEFPDTLYWHNFAGTEVQNSLIWWHSDSDYGCPWLYANNYDYWNVNRLLSNKSYVEAKFADYDHSTIDFFKVLFKTSEFDQYELGIDKNGDYKIFIKKEV